MTFPCICSVERITFEAAPNELFDLSAVRAPENNRSVIRSVDRSKKVIDVSFESQSNGSNETEEILIIGHGLYDDARVKRDPTPCTFVMLINLKTDTISVTAEMPV